MSLSSNIDILPLETAYFVFLVFGAPVDQKYPKISQKDKMTEKYLTAQEEKLSHTGTSAKHYWSILRKFVNSSAISTSPPGHSL